MEGVLGVFRFVLNALARSWWLLLLTIPVAVAVNVSGAAKYVRNAMVRRPAISILLATFIGSISPLCSCSVIPMILSLLTGGVPLAPVMSFWIASPSMDVEVFFLSVSTLGWELAIWRLASTFFLSLAAGAITHVVVRRGWIGPEVIRSDPRATGAWTIRPIRALTTAIRHAGRSVSTALRRQTAPAVCCAAGATSVAVAPPSPKTVPQSGEATCSGTKDAGGENTMLSKVARESLKTILFVGKFMLLAYFLEAIIVQFVPESWIVAALGPRNPLAIPTAALIGLPAYVTNLSALGLLGGLLQSGMIPSAAIAFLIAGPTTTLPAMSAVYGIAHRRVFALYLMLTFGGALFFGFLHRLVSIAL